MNLFQQNPSEINDEVARNFRQNVAQAVREGVAQQKLAPTNIPADFPQEPLHDPIQIVEINNRPVVRQPHIARPRPRPQRIRVQEQVDEEEENIPQVVRQQQRLRNPVPDAPIRQRVHSEEEDAETARYLRKQAENAHYSFDSSVQDTINDQAISRHEVR